MNTTAFRFMAAATSTAARSLAAAPRPAAPASKGPQTAYRSATSTATSAPPVRVLLVDDHPVVRKGLAAYIAQRGDLQAVGEAADGREAVRKARELRPDVVLLDIDMPNMSGLTAAELIRHEFPAVKVLVLTMHNHDEYVLRIIQAGASGYLLKDAAADEVLNAIVRVHRGETCFSAEVARVALNQFVRGIGNASPAASLTLREREVLIQIAEGLSNKEIACFLDVGVRTVETHRERIMKKLQIHSVAGLTRFAISKGMVSIHAGSGS